MAWKIKKVKGGHVVTWDGEEWGMEPHPLAWCKGYVLRLKARYPGGGAFLVTKNEKSRTRGGPWRYTMADGTTEVIHTERKADAKAVLRYKLNRTRLPAGITWEIES